MRLLYLVYTVILCSWTVGAQTSFDFTSALTSGQYKKAYNYLSSDIRKLLDVNELEKTMVRQIEEWGKFKSFQLNCIDSSYSEFTFDFYTIQFSRVQIDLKVVLNKEMIVEGFYFVPTKNCSGSYKSPVYSNTYFNVDSTFTVSETRRLKLLISKPSHWDKRKIAILVPGSGPNDLDGSVGKLKVLKDLALGLSQSGIATIRFKKFQNIQDSRLITFQDEYLDDLNSMIEFISQSYPMTKIYLIGHSLGGVAISNYNSAQVNGLVYLACNYKNLDSLIYRQSQYLFSLDNNIDSTENAILRKIKDDLVTLHLARNNISEDSLILGVPYSYWKSINAINLDSLLNQSRLLPKLFLQGSKDYQVGKSEFMKWVHSTLDHHDVKFIEMDGLSHLFTKSDGIPGPSDYDKPENVDARVIQAVVDFINSH